MRRPTGRAAGRPRAAGQAIRIRVCEDTAARILAADATLGQGAGGRLVDEWRRLVADRDRQVDEAVRARLDLEAQLAGALDALAEANRRVSDLARANARLGGRRVLKRKAQSPRPEQRLGTCSACGNPLDDMAFGTGLCPPCRRARVAVLEAEALGERLRAAGPVGVPLAGPSGGFPRL